VQTAEGEANMAKSKKRGKARKTSKARAKTAKQPPARAKSKRADAKKKKIRAMKPVAPSVETVVLDVVEQPAPNVITVTEFEETTVTSRDETEA